MTTKPSEQASTRIVQRDDTLGGEPVFEGTRIPVRHVGLLARKGTSLAEILEDYPALREGDVSIAAALVGPDAQQAPADPHDPPDPGAVERTRQRRAVLLTLEALEPETPEAQAAVAILCREWGIDLAQLPQQDADPHDPPDPG